MGALLHGTEPTILSICPPTKTQQVRTYFAITSASASAFTILKFLAEKKYKHAQGRFLILIGGHCSGHDHTT